MGAKECKEKEWHGRMEQIQTWIQQLGRMQWSDYLDIILVAFLIYLLLPLIRSTGTGRIAKVIAAVLVLAWVTQLLELHTLHFLVQHLISIGLISLVVLFQPELRRMLDHLGSMKLKNLLGVHKKEQEADIVISHVVKACEAMSRERVGALMVFQREVSLSDYVKTGTAVDAQISEQLLRNIFFPRASLHDGAVMICDGRIAAAGCVLPLSDSNRISADLGTRHRAGLGMSEATDALVVIVSEETGAVSVAIGGMLKRHLAPQTLEKLLHNELCREEEVEQDSTMLKLRQLIKKISKEDQKNED